MGAKSAIPLHCIRAGSLTTANPPVLLTLRAAASLLGVHPNTVRTHVTRGELPGTKVGHSWRFLETDLVAWIRQGYSVAARLEVGAQNKEALWHSGYVQDFFKSISKLRTERSLDALLERQTARRPKSIMTS
jgi:excisionase family DNA binding protein